MKVKDLRQGRKEFTARVKRVTRNHSGYGTADRPAPGQKPFLAAIGGFIWFYLILRMAQNRPLIEDSLSQGSLNATVQFYVQALVAVLIVASIVYALYLSFRATRPHPKRKTVSALVMGAGLAVTYCYMPTSVYAFGYELLDDNTKVILASANGTMSDWGIENIQAVSSWVPEVSGK